jgi:F0F1-type ATP synthase assembly protein I
MNARIYLILGAALAIAYLCGRYSAPEKVKIQKEIVQVEVQKKDEEKSGQKTEIITQIIRPDGTKLTRTRTQASHASSTKTETKIQTQMKETKEIINRSGVVVGPVIGIATSDLTHPIWGAVVDAPAILGLRVIGLGQVGPAVGVSASVGFGWGF